MRKILMLTAAAGLASVIMADIGITKEEFKRLSPEQKAAKIEEMRMQRTGGHVVKPGTDGARIYVLNRQNVVSANEFRPALDKLSSDMRIVIETVGNPPEDTRSPVVTLTDENLTLPPGGEPVAVLLAPESRRAAISVSEVVKAAPSPGCAASRVRKELVRTILALCHGGMSRFPEAVTRPIRRTAELDGFRSENPPLDVVETARSGLKAMGIHGYERTTYKQACIEGWAPAPTNEHQKAIYERVKAEKEQGPANPIKIERRK